MTDPQRAVSTILVVDDSAIDRRVAGRLVEKFGGKAEYAVDGAEALDKIALTRPDAVLTDMQMPNVDGLSLVKQIRAQFPRVPVILMTGHGSEVLAIAALKAGAAGYVPKKTLARELEAVLDQVLAASRIDDGKHRVLRCQAFRVARFILENDPALVQPLVGLLQQDLLAVGFGDSTDITRSGVSLEEALLNAIYHGNLEVSSRLKEDGDAFSRLATQRQAESPYRERRVRVDVRLTPERAVFTITDQGPGFDVAGLPDPTNPEYLLRSSGRGLLLMRAFMDEVRYNATGNRVTLVKLRGTGSG